MLLGGWGEVQKLIWGLIIVTIRGRPIYLLKANRYRYRNIGISILDIGIGIIGIGIGYEK